MRRAETMADKRMIQAVEATWKRLAPTVEAEFFLTNGENSTCASVAWEDRPLPIRLNLRKNGPGQSLPLDPEGRRYPEGILLHLIHMASHATATTPSGGSEGRYHGVGFHQAAKNLGLVTMERDDTRWSPGAGFAIDFSLYNDLNSPEWQELRRPKWYKRELDRLQVIREWEDTDTQRPRTRRGSVQMKCACTEETIKAGLKKRGLAADTGTGRSPLIAAPKIMSVSLGVAERMGIRCDDCGQLFERY